MIDLQQRNADRNTVLLRMFHAANGETATPFKPQEIRTALGWEHERFQPVVIWCVEHGWIKGYTIDGKHKMTPWGVDQIEAALSKPQPQPPTDDGSNPYGYL